MKDENNNHFALIALVAIVAVVGMVGLFMNVNSTSGSTIVVPAQDSADNVAGYAMRSNTCGDGQAACPSGYVCVYTSASQGFCQKELSSVR